MLIVQHNEVYVYIYNVEEARLVGTCMAEWAHANF
jgi:hypothetical protein